MEDQYDQMMRWCLGDDYMRQNCKASPMIFHELHPEYHLKSLSGPVSVQKQLCYYIFQMTKIWLKENRKRGCVKKCEVSTPEEEMAKVVPTLWQDLKSIFRWRKS